MSEASKPLKLVAGAEVTIAMPVGYDWINQGQLAKLVELDGHHKDYWRVETMNQKSKATFTVTLPNRFLEQTYEQFASAQKLAANA